VLPRRRTSRASVKSGPDGPCCGGLAVVHCRHEEAGMIGEDAAVYLSGDGPRAAAGVGPYDVGDE